MLFGSLMLAPTAGPPSPEYAGTPLPTTVLRTPGCLVVTIEIGSRLDLTEILEDGITHFNRPNSRTARALNIFGAIALFERAHDSLLNGRRFLLELETVAQHHCYRRNGRDRLGNIFSGNLRGTAVNGFKESHTRPDAGRRQHSERPRQHRGFITENIARH